MCDPVKTCVLPERFKGCVRIIRILGYSTLLTLQLQLTQVAQLWQRDRAKLDTFSINVQRYSHNYA